MAAGTPPFAPGIPPAAADTPPSGGPGLDRPLPQRAPSRHPRGGAPLCRARTGPRCSIFLASAAANRDRVVRFPVYGSGTPFGGGSSSQTSAPGARRADRPSALPSRGAARAAQRVRLDRQVRCKRTSTGVRAHSGGVSDSSTAGGAGRPSPKRRKCAMNPNANEKQGGHGARDRRPGTPFRGGPASGNGCERLDQDGMGLTSRRRGAAAPYLDSTPFATGRRPRTWTARRSPRGGGLALGQHAARHGADRPARGHPTRRDQHLRRRRRPALRGPPRPRNGSA